MFVLIKIIFLLMKLNIFKISILILIAFSTHLHAYTDPGSGSLIWQLILAALVGGLFYFKIAFRWLSGKFKLTKKNSLKNEIND